MTNFKLGGTGDPHDEIIVKELSHRLKNLLTMVQAIARQSLKYSSELTEFGQAFEARLASLARAHSLFTHNHWTSANIPARRAPWAPQSHFLQFEGTRVSPATECRM